MYRQSYHHHTQSTIINQQSNTGFAVMDPMRSAFLNATKLTASTSHFHKEQPLPAFIPEPRIRAMQMPELPEFFRQSRSFCEGISHKSNNSYNECLQKLIKNPFPPPSPLMLSPSPLLEKAAGHRLSNRPTNTYANGIMSENVQQRYLFSKKPNYGPLSIPVTTRYYPVTNDVRSREDEFFYDREEFPNYNYRFRSFGRRSSDAREPMPKLGQGDARLGDGILFGERKANISYNSCTVSASPPSLTYSPPSPRSLTSNYRSHIDTPSFGTRNLHLQSPQRAPAPIPVGPVPGKVKKKPFDRPPTPSCGDTDSEFSIPQIYEQHRLHAKPVPTTTIPPEVVHSNRVTEAAKKGIPIGPKDMTSNYHHQFDATAPEFEPAFKSAIRARPPKWKTQCKWTHVRVEDCRYGHTCHWGHEGDEYLDMPGVKHTFTNHSMGGGNLGDSQHDQVQHNQMQYGHSEYSVYSASSGYAAQQNPNYGVQQYNDGRMPDFSWVGGATNVSGWLGSQDKNNLAYGDSQIYEPENFYDQANLYTNAQIQDVSEIQPDAHVGSRKRKNYTKKKSKIGPKYWENNLKQEISMDEAVMTGGPNCEQLQDLPVADADYESRVEQPQDLSPEDADDGEISGDLEKQLESSHVGTKEVSAEIGGAK